MSSLARIGNLIATLPLAACSPLTMINVLTPPFGYDVAGGVPYGPLGRHKLDVYAPRDGREADRPVVLFLHGGRWSSGSRELYRFVGQALTSRGFVAVVADYRLYPEVRFPAFVEDAALAVAWTEANIAEHGGDPSRIVLMGHSAGAHISALLATEPAYLESAGADRARLAGLIGLAGPYDFMPITDPELQEVFGPTESHPLSQPIRFVRGGEPPMLLLHSRKDKSVSPRNSRNFAEKVREHGGRAETIYYDNLDHTRIVGVLAYPVRFLAPVLDDVASFVAEVTGYAPARASIANAASESPSP